MNYVPFIVFALVFSIAAAGVLATRYVVARRNREALRQRLEDMIGNAEAGASLELRSLDERQGIQGQIQRWRFYRHLESLLARAGKTQTAGEFLQLSVLLALIPWLLCFAFDFSPVLAFLLSMLLAPAPYTILGSLAERRRTKFQTQLPDAIDLMVSILKSGHSVPRAVRSVADEMPSPCGTEFSDVFHRMSLGQNLPDALARSVERYGSFELDMLRRATAIQVEVGGSLSDLLEKTNSTLRQRIKLKSQVRVLTAQSRLSAWIIGLMPLFIAVAFQMMNPSYMLPLTDSNIGKALLVAAAVAMVSGIVIMRKLSTIRV